MFSQQKMKKPCVWNKNTFLWSKHGKVPPHQASSASQGHFSNVCILFLKYILMTVTTLHGVCLSHCLTRSCKRALECLGSLEFIQCTHCKLSQPAVHFRDAHASRLLYWQPYNVSTWSDRVNQVCIHRWLHRQPTYQEMACCTHTVSQAC